MKINLIQIMKMQIRESEKETDAFLLDKTVLLERPENLDEVMFTLFSPKFKQKEVKATRFISKLEDITPRQLQTYWNNQEKIKEVLRR